MGDELLGDLPQQAAGASTRHPQGRLVVEAGLRLPGIGNDAIPFYARLYVNAGEGQDSIRVFAGLLFHVNKLVELFRK